VLGFPLMTQLAEPSGAEVRVNSPILPDGVSRKKISILSAFRACGDTSASLVLPQSSQPAPTTSFPGPGLARTPSVRGVYDSTHRYTPRE